MIHFICALKCEASALIRHYGLKHVQEAGLFNIYVDRKRSVSLTISGIGKLAAAAATTYSYTVLKCARDEVWLNLGIAGHGSHAIGGLYLANRIEDAGSAEVWYPQLVTPTDIPGAGLLCLESPGTEYRDIMYDMESAGFYSAACRFATSELIHCLKIISDNPQTPVKRISTATIKDLVETNTEKIVTFVSQLEALAAGINPLIDVSDDLEEFLRRWHFTQYQSNSLKQLLHRWHMLLPEINAIESVPPSCDRAKAVLENLQSQLDTAPFYLNGNSVDV